MHRLVGPAARSVARQMTTILHGCASGSGTEADSHRLLLLLLLLLLRGPKTSMFVFHPSTSRGIVNITPTISCRITLRPAKRSMALPGCEKAGMRSRACRNSTMSVISRDLSRAGTARRYAEQSDVCSFSLQAARWRVIFSGSEEKFCQLKGHPELPVGPA